MKETIPVSKNLRHGWLSRLPISFVKLFFNWVTQQSTKGCAMIHLPPGWSTDITLLWCATRWKVCWRIWSGWSALKKRWEGQVPLVNGVLNGMGVAPCKRAYPQPKTAFEVANPLRGSSGSLVLLYEESKRDWGWPELSPMLLKTSKKPSAGFQKCWWY